MSSFSIYSYISVYTYNFSAHSGHSGQYLDNDNNLGIVTRSLSTSNKKIVEECILCVYIIAS